MRQVVDPKATDWAYRKVWVATGIVPLHSSQVVTYGVPPKGFSSADGPSTFDPTHAHFEVEFYDSSPQQSLPSLYGTFNGAKLVEGKWLNWHGDVVAAPCAS